MVFITIIPIDHPSFILTVITEKDQLQDLGVTMSNDFVFSYQITKIVESGRSISSWILRTFTSRTQVTMLTLWKSLAIPILEYCSVLWSPTIKGDIQNIESIQWSFIRKIQGTSGMNYWEALRYHNLFSLERRRERYQILYIWKILEKLVPNISSSS